MEYAIGKHRGCDRDRVKSDSTTNFEDRFAGPWFEYSNQTFR